jgi:O-acetylhomoserine (thiol)-lyase
MKRKGFTTRSLNVPYPKNDPHHALQIPLYGAQAFEFDTSEQIAANFRGEYAAHVYSRSSNPTVEYFELKLRELTSSWAVLAVSSGMAAIADTILAIARTGDNIIAGNNLFGHTLALFKQTLPDLGIEVRFSSLRSAGEIRKLADENTRAIYFETVTNPQLEIPDIEMIVETARQSDILAIADSTLTPPNVFSGAGYGIHIEVMSTTKYISGGGTSFGGAIVDYGNYDWSRNPAAADFEKKFGRNAFIARLRKNIYRNTGGSMTAQTALLQIHGLDLLDIRVERCYQNCMHLGRFMEEHPAITRVGYPGLPGSDYHALANKYFRGIPGTIMTFDLKDEETCFSFMNKLKIIRRATNLNDNKSLIIHPWSTIYSEFTEDVRLSMGIRPSMLRLSVGIEDPDDLADDISSALD